MDFKMNFDGLVGLDEAGRGPLAGPVVAGCCVLPPDFSVEILNDSKKLTEKKRLSAEQMIKEKALWGIGIIDHETIDRINILQASLRAMEIAFEMVKMKYPKWSEKNNIDFSFENLSAITDGTFIPNISIEVRAEPKADGKYPCVMAASIIAKNERDRIMVEFDKIYPEYGYAGHKGYPTKKHKEICRQIGPSPIQRLSFNYK